MILITFNVVEDSLHSITRSISGSWIKNSYYFYHIELILLALKK